MVVMIIGLVLIGVSVGFHLNPNQPEIDWGAAWWVVPYLVGMGVISYFGGFGAGGIIGGQFGLTNVLTGGHGDLPLYYDLLVLAVFSLGIYELAMKLRLPTDKVDGYIEGVTSEPATA
jgi:hypothetical protein